MVIRSVGIKIALLLLLGSLNGFLVAQCSKCCGNGFGVQGQVGHRGCTGIGPAACHVSYCPFSAVVDNQNCWAENDNHNDYCAWDEDEWNCVSLAKHRCGNGGSGDTCDALH